MFARMGFRSFRKTGPGRYRIAGVGRVVHFEIHAGDMDRAERFYTDVFAWKVTRWDGAPVDYRLLTTGTETPGIDGALVERQGALDGVSVNAFVCTVQVDDIGETEKQVIAAGGEQVLDRMEIPGVGQVSYFKDTEGNIFGALQPAAA
jgi:predicted enzyme related to lactoylglutathione lyase